MGKTAKDDQAAGSETTTETVPSNAQDAVNAADAKGKKEDKAADKDSLDHGSSAPEVSLQGYLRTSGIPQDQTAGFASFANRTLPGRRTQNDWAKAFADFCAKPLI